MADEILSDFCLPWCTALTADSSWKAVPSYSRILHVDSTENAFLARTLRTPETVRACTSFFKASADARPLGSTVIMLFSLGSGLDGISGVCHGAFITMMLDEAMGQLMAMVVPRDGMITAELVVKFQRPLKTPAVVLCRSWIEREPEGRKLWVRGEVTDGVGGVYAEGKGLFMGRREKL
ncbi:hypothetical protein MMC30_008216 [Trapelia coarctata]|nr:hypothetical protein [Trapelia coarctata]